MKPLFTNQSCASKKSRCDETGSIRIVLLVLVSFLMGVAVTIFSFRHAAVGNTGPADSQSISETAAPPPAPEPVGQPATPPAPAPAPAPAIPQPIDPALIEQVKKSVPDYASISLADGERILRAAVLKEFADAAAETDAQMKAAQQQLQDAQNNGSAADQQAAMKHVQDTQAAATDKLKQIAANLQDQIAALKSLKNQQ